MRHTPGRRVGWKRRICTSVRALALVALVSGAVACSSVTVPEPVTTPALPSDSSATTAGTSAAGIVYPLRTYPTIEVGCDSIGVEAPVIGTLRGSAADASVVWLVAPDGARLEIVWPAGFSANIGTAVELLDGQAQHVAWADDHVYLQVPRGEAAGSRLDPYYATGLLTAGNAVAAEDPTGSASYVGCFGRR